MTNTFQVISPINDSLYLERSNATSAEIEAALAKAKAAQGAWRKTSIAQRAAFCKKAVAYFMDNVKAIATELTWQMGRPIKYTPKEITQGFKERADYMIAIAESSLASIPAPAQEGFRRYIQREPLGTVFVLAPWNYPYLTSVNAIIPALLAGNTVLLKHASQTPLCAERYAAAFAAAGLPEGVFQYLHLNHDQVANVIQDQRIDYVAFTGSVGGGAAVQRAMSSRFINAGLELGGKDPAYVCADADFENAVTNLVDGAFFNSGQSCCGIKRIYVDEKVYPKFVDEFLLLTHQYELGDPLTATVTLGPMVRKAAAAHTQSQIAEAVRLGAKALIAPKAFPNYRSDSSYMAPQILTNVNHDMELIHEESFGPLVCILPVKNEQEAVAYMNDSQYGLTASIWTTDLEKAIAIGQQVETGTFFMNRCDYLDPALAWTGVKNSGRGCTLSALGYEVLTRPKSFHLKLS